MRRWLIICLCALWVVSGRSLGFAHSELVSSEPVAGAVLDISPEEILLQFSEKIALTQVPVRVIGEAFETAELTVYPQEDRTQLSAAVDEKLTAGLYTIEYNVLSADGHTIQGSYNFTVADEPSSNGLIGIASLVGGIAVGLFLLLKRMKGNANV